MSVAEQKGGQFVRVLVTGGAGYIGSVAVERLIEQGAEVIVLDNLWRGHRAAVSPLARLEVADLCDAARTREVVQAAKPDAIMHFAAATIVPESVADPAGYFGINAIGTYNLLEAAREARVDKFVFSSSAAVYGIPSSLPVQESAETRPINPYGETKLVGERMLASYAAAYDLCYAAFRYFNVAGATESRGEDHHPETHVIPLALSAVLGERDHFAVFGTDYPTEDGTAVRDFVHVIDLADAHIAALERLDHALGPINLGSATGYSVRQIVEAVERVTGRPLPLRHLPRRPGDPPILVADPSRARELLGWEPRHGNVDEMIASAWRWRIDHPSGYAKNAAADGGERDS